MKKLIALFIILSMALCLFSCGSTDADTENDDRDDEIIEEEENEETEEPAEDETDSDEPAEDETDSDEPANEETDDEIEGETDNELQSGTVDPAPMFEDNEQLTLYADWAGTEIKNIYKNKVSVLWVETENGLYRMNDTEMENNYLDNEDIAEWGFYEFNEGDGFFYIDENGYYHIDEYLAYDITGEIFYTFYSFGGEFVVYSYDEEGHIYKSTFEKTGKLVEANVMQQFEEEEQDGYSFTTLGYYDTFESIRVLPAKGSYITGPDVLITVNGKTYVTNLNLIINNNISLTTNFALSEDAANNFLDYYFYSTAYSKNDVEDRLFYSEDGDEFVIYLPDGHTVDEITYFNRGETDMLVFENGDVYTWASQASILGETPEKNEALSSVGADIVEVIYCNTMYRVLMSDGCIYTIDEYYY